MASGWEKRYHVEFTDAAAKQLNALSRTTKERIVVRVTLLGDDPRPHGALKLKDKDDRYRIRVGNYRVVYSVVDERLIVSVVRVAHRKDVYRP